LSKNQLIIQVPSKPNFSPHLRRFTWPKDIVLDADPVDRAMSRNIFGFESVVTILRYAFGMSLSRDAEWDISQVEPHLRPSFIAAAKVFKRGVTVTALAEDSQNKSYRVDFCEELSDVFNQFHADDLVVVDSEVARFWWHRLPSGYLAFDFNERKKNIETLSEIFTLLGNYQKKNRNVVVVGGGVAGDVVGFACGLLAIPCHFVPTTLLAMVDSSIGGKVGINFEPWGKNQLGLFCPPLSVRIWTGWLSTLAEAELKSGAAEALKHAVLSGNRDLWSAIITVVKNKDWNHIRNLMFDVLDVKRDVVSRDPYELDERATLNFGHTLGHAVEILMSRRNIHVSHGACVALGMVHALRVSERRFGFFANEIVEDIVGAGLLPDKKDLDIILALPQSEIMELLKSDKKNDGENAVRFILLKEWGQPVCGPSGEWAVTISLEEAARDIAGTVDFLLGKV